MLAQIPHTHVEQIKLLLRANSAGATHELADWSRDAQIELSVGYDLTEPVRQAILETPPMLGSRRLTRTTASVRTAGCAS